ncbi:Dabb family protein [Saccharopolyspora sp. WRP15-2]|uniref:Dabb family protein n=1 Tax=Saccharopolyspora oryzae TaxID=2997343 RepID=A0ABT4UR07_9PSEU|nr:Dabb family protein [Saccharopolyspora oryzae]MDA3624094.1 Dabb family protein [Saccharopolyspora oryzae]
MPLQHVVAFRFGHPPTDDQLSQMAAGIESLSTIGEARVIRFGPDLTGARTRGYSHLLFMEFDDEHSLRRYQEHPVHLRFADWITAEEVGLLVFDYHVDDQTRIWPKS